MSFLTSQTTETVVETYIVYQLFSAAVQSLPNPAEYGGIWYKTVYNFLSILAADFKSFVKVPTVVASTEESVMQSKTTGASPVTSTTTSTVQQVFKSKGESSNV